MGAKMKWVIIATIMIMISGMAYGAGGQEEGEAAEGQVIDIYWNPDHLYDAYNEVINEFAEENNLTVNMQIFNWNDFRTKLNADFTAGTVPDLIEVPSQWILEFAGMDGMVDLTEEIESWDQSNDWFESTWNEVTYEGRRHGLKLHHTAFGLFYNVDHFDQAGIEPPETLAEFEAAINRIDEVLGPDVKPFGFDPTGQYLIPFLATRETPSLIEDGEIAIGTPTVRETLRRLQAIARSGKVVVPDPGGEEARTNVRQLFFAGEISMMISGPWEIGNIRSNFPDLNYSVAMIPSPEGVEGLTYVAGTGLGIPAGGDIEPDLVFELMKRLTSVEVEVAATLEAGMLMPRKTWANDPRVQDDRAVQLFGPLLPKAVAFDIDVRKLGLPEITWGGPVFKRMYETMIYTDRDTDAALDQYIQEANRLIESAQR